jgi:hypothetical protein
MSGYGVSPYGAFPYGGGGSTSSGAPFLVESNPVHGSANNEKSGAITFTLEADGGVLPASLDVWLLGETALVDGVFQAGYAGSLVVNGDQLYVTISTHPLIAAAKADVVIYAESTAFVGGYLSFWFLVEQELLSGLVAKTGCDGKLIDLRFTVPSGVTRVRIKRSRFAFCQQEDDPGESLYEGAATNLDATAMDRFVDGVFSSAVYRTTNTALLENTFYYYSVFLSYSSGAPYTWVSGKACQVEGLSIRDYYALYEDWVYKLLPPNYRQADADPNRGSDRYKLRDLCRVLQCSANLQRGWLEALLHLRDPDNTPAGRIGEAENQAGLLAAHAADLGFPPERAFDAGVLRRIVLGITPVHKQKGTCPGLVNLAKLFAGWDARCDEQIEPNCGVGRLFSFWDNESKLYTFDGSISAATVGVDGYVTFNTGVTLNASGAAEDIALSSSDDSVITFVIDAFGTFACVDSVVMDSGRVRINFTEPHARMRAEITGSGTGALNSFTINSVDFSSEWGGWPWQFSNEEPTFSYQAFKDLEVMDSAGNVFTITGSAETDGSGNTILTVSGTPASGVFSISSNFVASGSYAGREPYWKATLYCGEFSLSYHPAWDTRLMLEGAQGPWSLFAGLGSLNVLGATASPADVVVWVQDAHEYLGTVASVTSNTLLCERAQWLENEYAGMYLLPNWNQTQLYRIIHNTATLLVVDVPGGGLDLVTGSGFRFVILSEDAALKYAQLTKLLPSFTPEESVGVVKFERAFEPSDLDGLVYDFRADRGVVFSAAYPLVNLLTNYGDFASFNYAISTGVNRYTFDPNPGDYSPVMQADATDFMALDTDPAFFDGSFTLFFVVKYGTFSGTVHSLFSAGHTVPSAYYFALYVDNTGSAYFDCADGNSQATDPLELGAWNIIAVTYDASAEEITLKTYSHVNGEAVTPVGSLSITPPSPALEVMSIGDDIGTGGGSRHAHEFRRMLGYNVALTDEETAKVLRYLREEHPGL